MRFPITDISKLLVRILDNRRALVRIHRRDLLDHPRNLHRIVHNDLARLRRAKVGKFIQHFFCRTQEERSLVICIVKTFSRHDDTPVHLVIRIEKMNITRCHYWFPELLPQFHDLPVDVLQILL